MPSKTTPTLEYPLNSSESVIYHWLGTIGATTWGGQGWDITDPDERAEAAKWLAATIKQLPFMLMR